MSIRLSSVPSIFLAFAGISAAHTGEAPDATTLHHINTVFVIVMENHNWTGDAPINLKGNPAAPYINYTLLPMASYANNYNNPPGNHPSLPNYLWIEAGTNFGIHDDGSPYQHHQATHDHLVKLWRTPASHGARMPRTSAERIAPFPTPVPAITTGIRYTPPVTTRLSISTTRQIL